MTKPFVLMLLALPASVWATSERVKDYCHFAQILRKLFIRALVRCRLTLFRCRSNVFDEVTYHRPHFQVAHRVATLLGFKVLWVSAKVLTFFATDSAKF